MIAAVFFAIVVRWWSIVSLEELQQHALSLGTCEVYCCGGGGAVTKLILRKGTTKKNLISCLATKKHAHALK